MRGGSGDGGLEWAVWEGRSGVRGGGPWKGGPGGVLVEVVLSGGAVHQK